MGNANTISLENYTNEVIDIIDDSNIILRKTVEARRCTDIKPKEYDGDGSKRGPPLLMIACGGRLLRSAKGDYLFPGKKFFSTCFEKITIHQQNDQNPTGVVNYEVEFHQRGASGMVNPPLKFFRDPVWDHDYGWSVQIINRSVKLTREEGVTMILDPLKLFARINDSRITSLLHMVLQFWPRTFADLYHKDNLMNTIKLVKKLMVQAREYNANRSKGKVEVIGKLVSDLNTMCAAKVEWYRPLFPGMENHFLPVVEQMTEVDKKKLEEFATIMLRLLQQPNSLPGKSSRK